MGVDQPRQHGRIAVVDQFTLGGQLVRRRFDPHDATVLDEHSRTASAEVFTIKGVVCTDCEHSAWLPNALAPVNALPWRRCARSGCCRGNDKDVCRRFPFASSIEDGG